MNSTNNLMLYIKRAEQHHTKDFIVEAFASNNIGKVRDVRFIKKMDMNGREYNGAVVIFEHWNMNTLVKQLLDQMSVSKDGTTKFVFDQYRGRYWFINIYKTQFPEYEEITTIDTGLPDKERITELENLVKSMSAQMHYMRTSQEKLERQLMEAEHTNTQHHLFNIELKIQVDEAKREKKWAEDKLNEKINIIEQECELLQKSNIELEELLNIKAERCDELNQELYDNKCIIEFVQSQSNEMYIMLNSKKMTIDELV